MNRTAPHPMLARAIALSQAGRNAEAVLLVNQAAASGDAASLAMLAEMKWRGGMVPQDLPAARALYGKAGDAGHRQSAGFHTNLLASGIAGPRDWPAALARLRREAAADPQRARMLKLIEAMALTPDGEPAALSDAEPLSVEPDVTLLRGLFTKGECDYLRAVAEPQYVASFVNDAAGRQVRDPIRTSDGSTIAWLVEDPAVHAINRRLAAASGTQAEQGEAIQILRYRPGQEYRPHMDFVRGGDNVRALTALIYLNHDYQGGETRFVKTGLQVKGRTGDALIFRNALPDGQPDPLTEHAGMPVTSGTKYLASRWIRERRWAP